MGKMVEIVEIGTHPSRVNETARAGRRHITAVAKRMLEIIC